MFKNQVMHRLHSAVALSLLTVSYAFGQTGTPPIQPFDDFMNGLLSKHKIPGGSLAVVKDGKLVLARGYGLADPANKVQAQPDSRYRIASLSKFITAVAVLHLVDQGKLTLDQKAFDFFPDLAAPFGMQEDDRLGSITIAHLLTHTAGWDSTASNFDPMFASDTITAALGVSAPASSENTIRYMRGQQLDFDPGLYYRYSNFGYNVLGRIIERVTGMNYEQYVRTQILAPMGIAGTRIGNTLESGRLPGEVVYTPNGTTNTVFPDADPKQVPWPYGGWCVECQDAHGGWVTTVIDYARFMTAVDGRRGGKAFLSPESIAAMTARPGARDWDGASAWYGFGIMVRPVADGQNWWHSGSLDGTTTYQIRSSNGFNWIVFLNWRPTNDAGINALQSEIDSGLWNATSKVTAWPDADYFATLYPDADPTQAAAQPFVNARDGVLNAATVDRGVVSGSWGVIRGNNLAASPRGWTAADISRNRLPLSLDGVSVKVNGEPAFLFSIAPNEIVFQAPQDLPSGWLPVEVLVNDVSTGMVLAHITSYAPGLFTYQENGTSYANVSQDDGTDIADGAAMAGQVITLFATGLEPSRAGILASMPQQAQMPVVTIGGMNAKVRSTALVGPGTFAITIVVPDMSAGDQAIVLTSNGVDSPFGVFLKID